MKSHYVGEYHIEPFVEIEKASEELEQEARDSVLPQRITQHGEPGEPLVEVIFCDMISGGADYEDDMPRSLSLVRKLANGEEYRAKYRLVERYPDLEADFD